MVKKTSIMLNIAVLLAASVAVVYSGMSGRTELAFWLAVVFFAASASLLWYSVRDPLRDPLRDTEAAHAFKDAIGRMNVGLVMVTFLSGVWAIAAVLPMPRPRGLPDAAAAQTSVAGRCVASVIALIGVVAVIPIGAYLVMEFWAA